MRYHNRLGCVVLLTLSLLILCTAAYSNVVYVKPSGNDGNDGSTWDLAKQTITSAISASLAGDEIWVATGVYGECIFIKSGIQLYGGFAGTEDIRENRNWEVNPTTIDASLAANPGSVVTFAKGVSDNTRLDGFVIRGGTGTLLGNFYYGGGIYCADRSSPTIANNTITDNSAESGAGIFCHNFSRPVIQGNTITDNTGPNDTIADWGGGIYCWYDPPQDFPETSEPPQADIIGNVITNNMAKWGGGVAVFCSSSVVKNKPTANLRNNIVLYNGYDSSDTSSVGGGIYCEYVSPLTITGNTIYGNLAGRSAGLHCANSSAIVSANRISGNVSTMGSGIGMYYSTATIANNEVSANFANARGGGIYCKGFSSSIIINNTVAGNLAYGTGGGLYIEDSAPSVANNIVAFNSDGIVATSTIPYSTVLPNIRYNCVYKNGTTNYGGNAKKGAGDISIDPKLASSRYCNLHIQPDSPCINAGEAALVQPGLTDIDGQIRVREGRVDIGADESDGTVWTDSPSIIIHVSNTGSDDNDGSSWDLAKLTIQAGIDAAAYLGGEVWVKAGTYNEHVILRPFIHLYGGFSGTETEKFERDWVANETIISPGWDFGYAVRIQPGHGLHTVDGFTISQAVSEYGPAIICHNASPNICNNKITQCVAIVSGGGIYCEVNSSPLIYNNIIDGCEAHTEYGGAIYCINYSSPKIVNNRITGNRAVLGAAGIYIEDECSPIIANNLIDNNYIMDDPLIDQEGQTAILCIGNRLTTSPKITGNTIVWNTYPEGNGAAVTMSGSSPTIANNIMAYNSSGIYVQDGTPLISSNCMFENGTYNYYGTFPGTGDIERNPEFVDGRNADPNLRNYHLLSISPCIDAGDDKFVDMSELDMDLASRVYGAHVDMGVDEWRGLSNVSLSPNGGLIAPGQPITLTSEYYHPDGYEHLADCYMIINSTLTGRNAICVRYNVANNVLYVRNDTNTLWIGGYAPGSANVVENSYFKLYCTGSSAGGAGSMLTVSWQIEAKATMAGKKCPAWMMVDDDAGIRDGWDKMGEFVISRAPYNISLSPNSGTLPIGEKITLTSQYGDLDGYADTRYCYLLVNTSLSEENAVFLLYNAATNKIWLRNEANTDWLGGYSPGLPYVIDNSYARVYCHETTVTGTGAVRQIKWRVMFKPTMTGKNCPIWMMVQDNVGLKEDWKQMGSVVFTQPPVNVSLSPSSGTIICERDTTFSCNYSDGDGNDDISSCYLIINSTLTGLNGIYAKYDAVANKLYLRNDANTAWIGGYTPGDPFAIENSQARVDCSQTTVFRSGNNLTVNWKIRVNYIMAGKTASAWLLVIDKANLRDNYKKMGEYKFDYFTHAPVNVSLSPSSGTIICERDTTFSCKYSDADGNADISSCYLIINSTLTGLNGIYVKYDAVANKLYLRNDANTDWIGGYTPGGAFTIENSQARVDCSQTAVYRSGSDLMVNWKIRIKSSMAGKTASAWLLVIDKANLRDNYKQMSVYKFSLTL